MYRTHTCGELSLNNIKQEVILCGWVERIRVHGNLMFIDLKDRYGLMQLVFDSKLFDINKLIKEIKKDYVLQVEGEIKRREQPNPKIKTGEIELFVHAYQILNKSEPIPIDIHNPLANIKEENRMKYRYIDLRRDEMRSALITRHKIKMAIHKFFDKNGFIEIETPILAKSTPEGARDYLVPSRINKGKFYALPQSPQLFKQLLMIAGFDRYYQIARCFRDEDLRADRQPEFSQLDIEMSFVTIEDIITINEKFLTYLFHKVLGVKINTPFPRINYLDALEKYGSDKPDLRFGLELRDITKTMEHYNIDFMKNKHVKCLVVSDKDKIINKKRIKRYEEIVKKQGAQGLSYLLYHDKKLAGNISRLLDQDFITKLNLKNNDVVFIIADHDRNIVNLSLGELRNIIASDLNLINDNDNEWKFCWILNFPMFEWSEEEQRWKTMHHPFTSPVLDDIGKIKQFLINREKGVNEAKNHIIKEVRSLAYDIVVNGVEIGGGSIRIHQPDLQRLIFKVVGLGEKEIEDKFGFFLKALQYGAPPHGGIAYGLDRLVAVMTKKPSIREVIAFPKNKDAMDLMLDTPSEVSDKQLDELGINIKNNKTN